MKIKYTEEEFDKAKSQDKLLLECYNCQNTFLKEKRLILQTLTDPLRSNRNKYCYKSCENQYKTTSEIVECKKCGKQFKKQQKEIKKHPNHFCSHSCSASYNNTKRIKKKFVKKEIILHTKECEYCKNEFTTTSRTIFCSRCCRIKNNNKSQPKLSFSECGRRSVAKQKETRRSKNEKLFFKLCQNYFKDVKSNEPIFNGWDADVIIEDIQVAILWNGKWHYEKITEKHSVKQVQNRDNIKIKEIENYGYTPYIIKDMGKFNEKFVKEQFENFLLMF